MQLKKYILNTFKIMFFEFKQNALLGSYKALENVIPQTHRAPIPANNMLSLCCFATICRSANPNYLSKLSIVTGLVSDLLTLSENFSAVGAIEDEDTPQQQIIYLNFEQ